MPSLSHNTGFSPTSHLLSYLFQLSTPYSAALGQYIKLQCIFLQSAGDNEAEFVDEITGKQVCVEKDMLALVFRIL